jgi:hypothetical protein
LALYSEQFDNAYWSKLGTTTPTITANATTSPDGTTNADLLTGTGGVGQRVQRTMSVSLLTSYSVSIYVKANTSTTAQLNIYDGVTDRGGEITFSTGAVTTYGTGVTASSTNVGNGWYRFTINYTSFATISINIQFGVSGSTSYYLWGAQLEASSYPTSYIPTTSASATRIVDTCLNGGSSALFNSPEGVLFFEGNVESNSTPAGGIAIIGSSGNRVQLFNSGSNMNALVEVGGAAWFANTTVLDITQNHKYAISWALNDYTFYADGVQIASLTSGATFSASTLNQFRFSDSGVNYFYGKVKQVAVFPSRLTNAQLIDLTT